MSYVWGPTDALWAGRLGELCGGALGGPAAEWKFLEGWMDLFGAGGACLALARPGEAPILFCRGVDRRRKPSADEVLQGDDEPVSVVDGLMGGAGPLLRIVANGGPGRRAVLLTTDSASRVALLGSLYPCVERALVRLAEGRGTPAEATARGAWDRAAVPMLLLKENLSVSAANPACGTQLGVVAGEPLPPWLGSHLQTVISGVTSGGPAQDAWTTADAGATYRMSVVAVDPTEGLPGRWLVSVVKGGPAPRERAHLAEEQFGLTGRETELVELLAEGLSNRQLAGAFGVTEATVKAHLVNVMRKAEAPSRTELLARLYSLHIADPEVEIPADALRLATGHIWQADDGIVHCHQDAGTEIEVEDIKAFEEAVHSFYDGEVPVLVYSDATGVRSSPAEANKAAGVPMPFVGALAVRGGTAVSRALVNLFMKVSRPPYPTRLFRDRESALQWLHSLRGD